MWAVARTPALVDAIERVESSNGAATPLSHALRNLRDADLSDPPRLRQAIEAADAFLQDSRLLTYDAMEPMDAIRGIVGLCGDSARVLEEAVSSVYRWVLTAFQSVAPYSGEDERISRVDLCPAGAVQVQVLAHIHLGTRGRRRWLNLDEPTSPGACSPRCVDFFPSPVHS